MGGQDLGVTKVEPDGDQTIKHSVDSTSRIQDLVDQLALGDGLITGGRQDCSGESRRNRAQPERVFEDGPVLWHE